VKTLPRQNFGLPSTSLSKSKTRKPSRNWLSAAAVYDSHSPKYEEAIRNTDWACLVRNRICPKSDRPLLCRVMRFCFRLDHSSKILLRFNVSIQRVTWSFVIFHKPRQLHPRKQSSGPIFSGLLERQLARHVVGSSAAFSEVFVRGMLPVSLS
jgi:hypothetical protein